MSFWICHTCGLLTQAQALADDLGIKVAIVDKPLSWNGGEWKQR